MSLVNNEELKNLTNTTNGSINKQVVDFAKNILFSQLKSYISDEKQYKIINDKMSNMKIELLSSPDFKDKFYESNGKGFLPAAFVYGGIIYFRNDINFDINDFRAKWWPLLLNGNTLRIMQKKNVEILLNRLYRCDTIPAVNMKCICLQIKHNMRTGKAE